MSEDLGTRLLRAGLVTGAGLARCLARGGRDLEHGGRLAAALTESDLAEDALVGFFLSEGLGPLVSAVALQEADADLRHQLSLDDAFEQRCLPLSRGAEGVLVAMTDPSSEEALGAIERLLGEHVVPALARWSDIRAALALSLGAAKPSIEQPRRGIDDWSDLSDPAESAQVQKPPPERERLPDIGSALSEIRATLDRDLLFRRASEAIETVCRSFVLFIRRDDALKGWECGGASLKRDSIRELWIPTGSPSVFRDVVAEGDPYRGPHGERTADRVFRATVGSDGRDLLVLPVQVNGKVVALFACDEVTFGDEGADRARIVAHAVGAALKRIILSRRG